MNSEKFSNFGLFLEWLKSHWNGDWEHSYGFDIGTMDNPGFSITIDLQETECADYPPDSRNRDYEAQYQADPPAIWYEINRDADKFVAYCSFDAFDVVFGEFMEFVSQSRKDQGLPQFNPNEPQMYEEWYPQS